jgi:hypothetical protein
MLEILQIKESIKFARKSDARHFGTMVKSEVVNDIEAEF